MLNKASFSWLNILLLLMMQVSMNAQIMRVFNIDTDYFPEIRANYEAVDGQGQILYGVKKNEVDLLEKGEEKEILYLSSPSKEFSPISVILVFDISGSMDKTRLEIAKKAGAAFINKMELAYSEAAILTFNANTSINSDFSHNKDQLIKTINRIKSKGGTNYDNAFVEEPISAIPLARRAKNKRKYIIFMTDGLSDADQEKIISQAQAENISTFCVTIELEIPEVLKNISIQTGGDYFENVNTSEHSKEIYEGIYNNIQANRYGTIKWITDFSCDPHRSDDITIRNLSAHFDYEIPEKYVSKLIFRPSALYFPSPKEGTISKKPLEIKAINSPIIIENIAFEDTIGLKFSEKLKFPFEVSPSESKAIEAMFNSASKESLNTTMLVAPKNCDTIQLTAYSGQRARIEITQPSAGDEFAASTNTQVHWEGIDEDRRVILHYRKDKGHWRSIGVANGGQIDWTLPSDTGTTFQVMAHPKDESSYAEIVRLTDHQAPLRASALGNSGRFLATNDVTGNLIIWDLDLEKAVKTMDGSSTKSFTFNKYDTKLLTVTSSGLSVQSILKPVGPALFGATEGLALSAYNDHGNREKVVPAKILSIKNGYKIWDPLNDHTVDIPMRKRPKNAALSNNGKTAILVMEDYTLKYWNVEAQKMKAYLNSGYAIKQVIANEQGTYCAMIGDATIEIINTTLEGGPPLMIEKSFFVRYSPDGNKLISRDFNGKFEVWDLLKGEKIVTLARPRLLYITDDGSRIFHFNGQELSHMDIDNQQVIFSVKIDSVSRINVNEQANEFLLVRNGKVHVYDMEFGEPMNHILHRNAEVFILDAMFNAHNETIITINTDNTVSIWAHTLTTESAITGNFSLIAPKAQVKSKIDFGSAKKSESVEKLIEQYITNNTSYPIKINKLEIIADADEVFDIVSSIKPFEIAPNQKRAIELRFTARSGKKTSYQGTLLVESPFHRYTTELVGTKKINDFKITHKYVNLGQTELFTTIDTQVVVLKNLSKTTALDIQSIKPLNTQDRQFKVIDAGLKSLVPNAMLEIKLAFTAERPGLSTKQFEITFANGESTIITVIAEGIAPEEIILTGKVFHGKTNIPQKARINLINLATNINIAHVETESNGQFSFNLKPGLMYSVSASKDGFISSSEHIDLTMPSMTKNIVRDLKLFPLESGTMITLNNIFFEFNKATLKTASYPELNKMAEMMKEVKGLSIEIHGHTDNVGTDQYNLDLSNHRASAVRTYLVSQGIQADRIGVKAFGETLPIADNNTEEGREQNRRVEIMIE